MIVDAIFIVLSLLSLMSFVYATYKVIWYSTKIIALNSMIKDINGNVGAVSFMHNLKNVLFGKKGTPYFVLNMPNRKYEVSLLSFISTHSRWNIEKTNQGYDIEIRKYNNVFYNTETNTGTEPEHARDYRRETRYRRCELYLSPKNEEYTKQILLIYPRPKFLTYTETRLEHLIAGNKIEGHEIAYIDNLVNIIEQKTN